MSGLQIENYVLRNMVNIMVFVIISSCLYCTETTRYEHKNKDKTKYSKPTPENVKISGTILVISVGSLFCVMLILVIIREVCLCWRSPKSNGRRTTRDDVYADITANWKDVNRMK